MLACSSFVTWLEFESDGTNELKVCKCVGPRHPQHGALRTHICSKQVSALPPQAHVGHA